MFQLGWTSFKRKWPISRKLQKGSREWVTLIILYHTRKQPRIKNLLSWDYPMNFPPSIMKDFCLPVDKSSSTMLSKYIVPHLLTVTIVVPFDFRGDKKINQKRGSWWLVVPPVQYSYLMCCLLELMLRYLGYVSLFSLMKMFLYHLGQFGIVIQTMGMLCPASGITNVPLEWFLKAWNGVEQNTKFKFWRFFFLVHTEIKLCLSPPSALRTEVALIIQSMSLFKLSCSF